MLSKKIVLLLDFSNFAYQKTPNGYSLVTSTYWLTDMYLVLDFLFVSLSYGQCISMELGEPYEYEHSMLLTYGVTGDLNLST